MFWCWHNLAKRKRICRTRTSLLARRRNSEGYCVGFCFSLQENNTGNCASDSLFKRSPGERFTPRPSGSRVPVSHTFLMHDSSIDCYRNTGKPQGAKLGPNKFKAPLIEPFSHQLWFLSEGSAGRSLSAVIYLLFTRSESGLAIDPEQRKGPLSVWKITVTRPIGSLRNRLWNKTWKLVFGKATMV